MINLLSATPRQIRGNAEGAVPSPDGSLVAFRNSAGESQVLVSDSSGDNVRLLATAPLNENFGQLQWSPDGLKVGVIVRRVGERDGSIDAIAVADGRRTEIARLPAPRSFTWLPDGRLVVATRGTGEFNEQYLQAIDSRGRRRVVEIGAGSSVTDISTTADGRQLAVVRASELKDVYTAVIESNHAIGKVQRLTLDDREDHPSGWWPDGRSVLFESNRNGTLDVFRQSIDSGSADLVAGGAEDQFGAQVTPDGSAILYWSGAESNRQLRLMKMSANGGGAEMVTEAPAGSQYRCARGPAAGCLLARVEGASVSLESLDWRTGERRPWRTVPVQSKELVWALAGNASVALADGGRLRVFTGRDGAEWSIPAASFSGSITGVGAGANASEWLVATSSSRDNRLLLASRTAVRTLWQSPSPMAAPMLSPDGRRVQFGVTASSSNAWLVEQF